MKDMRRFDLCAGYSIDIVLGDPAFLPHPVVGMGLCIEHGERWFRRLFSASPWGERCAGTLLSLSLCLAAWGFGNMLSGRAQRKGASISLVLQSVLAASTLATKSLLQEAHRVERALQDNDLPAARVAVARIVGRDTAELSESGIARACIESLAESLCDGIAAPLCALAVGGMPLALCYKAINTLDSMIGHREAPYTYFGSFAARLDDVVNYVPARLSAIVLSMLAPLTASSTPAIIRIVCRDAQHHRSPNAGYPETAMAAALGVRLGGPTAYAGIAGNAALLNEQGREPLRADITRAMRLTAAASLCLMMGAVIYGEFGRKLGRR